MDYLGSTSYEACTLCPRVCSIDRTTGHTGFCGQSSEIRLACATLHRGEEPPLVTGAGSGALFFSGCTLGCRDCQNWQLSREGAGRGVSAEELAEIMLHLETEGAANINFVTATQFIPSIVYALEIARSRGLGIPTVWNTSGFESASALDMLKPWIDIFLTDIKTLSSTLAIRETGRGDYPDVIREVLPVMLMDRDTAYDGETLVRGVIVRHLVLPEYIEESLDVIRWYGQNVGSRGIFSLMTQYLNPRDPGCERGISAFEYELLSDALAEAGIEEGFLQEPSGTAEWLPDFTRSNPFPDDYSRVLWHYRKGAIRR
ncbi:radical SAM protein [Marispirochaeta aestuarii]|uniref:radical SAM protein n=1 Tax=Marispirochaeta aestuarii TaxID=1963862 RepID=UPI0029C60608|nr:radical SAM protein [Marispirochaeta aestuarii]